MILHTLKKSDWERCKDDKSYGRYSLDKCGFIHCSDVKDVVEVANSHFLGIKEVVLLCIDPSKVKAPVKWEDFKNCGVKFPHIYGELNLDAIVEVIDFPTNDDGTFILPHQLEKYK
jgi:uncharacterized protein (DUF952 family)